MKKIFFAVLAAAMLLLSATASAEDNIKIMINGEELQCSPAAYVQNDRLLVPMRTIFEKLNAMVGWDQDTQTITAAKNDFILLLQIDNLSMFKNNEKIDLDVAPTLVEDRTMVPIRAVTEAFNIPVDWNEDAQEVTINF